MAEGCPRSSAIIAQDLKWSNSSVTDGYGTVIVLRGTKTSSCLFSTLCWPLFEDRICLCCGTSINVDQTSLQHLTANHLRLCRDDTILLLGTQTLCHWLDAGEGHAVVHVEY